MTTERISGRRQFQPAHDARDVAVRSRPARDAGDVAVERLHHSEYELAHSLTPPHRFPAGYIRMPPLCNGLRAGRVPSLQYLVERPDRNSTNRQIKNIPAGLALP